MPVQAVVVDGKCRYLTDSVICVRPFGAAAVAVELNEQAIAGIGAGGRAGGRGSGSPGQETSATGAGGRNYKL